MAISNKAREEIYKRSDKQCEAMVLVDVIWTRFGISPVEIHHMLKRSQGGNTLDEVGETYHLIALCPAHHKHAHTTDKGYQEEVLILGDVIWDNIEHRPVYRGPDPTLSKRYPPTQEKK